MEGREDTYGLPESPGGFVFGVSGFHWGEPRPTSITFFLDNTTKVSDQHGRPMKGAVKDGVEYRFAQGPPTNNDNPNTRSKLATHAQVIAALAAERIDWTKLSCAGFPQLCYGDLKKMAELPPTPIEELRKIKDHQLRKDALRVRREVDEARAAEEMQSAEED